MDSEGVVLLVWDDSHLRHNLTDVSGCPVSWPLVLRRVLLMRNQRDLPGLGALNAATSLPSASARFKLL